MTRHSQTLALGLFLTTLSLLFSERVYARGNPWKIEVPVTLEVGAGYMDGEGTLDVRGAYFSSDISIVPALRYKKRKFILRLPISFEGMETVGFSLPKRHFLGGPELSLRPNKKLEIGFEAMVGWNDRQGWPDQYQPELDGDGQRTGTLLATDRFSNFHFEFTSYAVWKFNRKYDLELYGRYYDQNNIDDPNYYPADNPTHLVPGDRNELEGGLKFTGRTPGRKWRYSLDSRCSWGRYPLTYARDARTGLTHAGIGGPPPNPAQRFLEIRIRQRNSFKLVDDLLRLVVAVTYTHNLDVWDNYYTWNKLDWYFKLEFKPHRLLNFELFYSGDYQLYTSYGYRTAPNHPPLDNGDNTRNEYGNSVKTRIEISPFLNDIVFFIEGERRDSTTNFPDYEPYIYPSARAYKIDWDYINWRAEAGVVVAF